MRDQKRYEEFAALVRMHTNQMLAYLDSLLLNRSDSEDVFQETCLVLWQKFDEFQPGTKFLAWALRVADFKVMNFQQKRARHAAFAENVREALKAEIASRKQDAVDDADLASLSRCMERLDEADRTLVTLCYAQSEPVREIADTLGRSPQSVHHSLRRVRNWLLECIHRELNRTELPTVSSDTPEREDGR